MTVPETDAFCGPTGFGSPQPEVKKVVPASIVTAESRIIHEFIGPTRQKGGRFEQLQRDCIDDEEQVEKFLRILEEKGRIPFSRGQAPAYPGTGEGLDKGRP